MFSVFSSLFKPLIYVSFLLNILDKPYFFLIVTSLPIMTGYLVVDILSERYFQLHASHVRRSIHNSSTQYRIHKSLVNTIFGYLLCHLDIHFAWTHFILLYYINDNFSFEQPMDKFISYSKVIWFQIYHRYHFGWLSYIIV